MRTDAPNVLAGARLVRPLAYIGNLKWCVWYRVSGRPITETSINRKDGLIETQTGSRVGGGGGGGGGLLPVV